MKKVIAIALIVLGGIWGPGIPACLPMLIQLGLLIHLGSMEPAFLVGLAVEFVAGIGILIGGIALWGRERWRKVVGIVLTAGGAQAWVWLLASLSLMQTQARIGRPLPLVSGPYLWLAMLIGALVGALYLALGIWLIVRQGRIDKAQHAQVANSSGDAAVRPKT